MVLAALNFGRHLGQLKDQPLQNQPPPPRVPMPRLEVEPGQPVNLSERVFHAFAHQNMPVYKPLSLPITRIRMTCPGARATFCGLSVRRVTFVSVDMEVQRGGRAISHSDLLIRSIVKGCPFPGNLVRSTL